MGLLALTMNEDSITSSLVLAASVIWPGVVVLIFIVSVRSWLWRTRYLGKSGKRRGKRSSEPEGD